jgi:DNA recombination protein RmuC
MELILAAFISAAATGVLLLLLPAVIDRRQRDVSAGQLALYQRMDGIDQRLDGIQSSVGSSLSSTAETIGRIGEQLGSLGKSADRILEVGQDIASLQDILQPPKLRGGFGEILMERLLAEIVPGRYTSQHRFRSGEVVDAVVHLAGGMVPVDSKFPLDAFARLLSAGAEDERRAHRRDFERAVRGHIDAVSRYIRADEGTLDFALMYIPAENVFYEVQRSDLAATARGGAGRSSGLLAYAQERRVFPVSPSTMYMYLSAIALGLRGLRVEEQAREIIGRLGRLNDEFGRFQREFGVLGGHLEGARKKYDALSLGLQRLSDRLSLPFEDEPEPLREPDQPSLIAG